MRWPWMTLASQLCWNCSCNSALVVSSPARRPLWSCMARSKVSTWQKGKPKRSSFHPEALLYTFDKHTVTTLYHISKILTRNRDTPQDAPQITAICALYVPKGSTSHSRLLPSLKPTVHPSKQARPQKETIVFQASELLVSGRVGHLTLILLGKLQKSAHLNRHINIKHQPWQQLMHARSGPQGCEE